MLRGRSDSAFSPPEIHHLSKNLQGLYSLSGKTPYRQISWSLEAARLCVIIIVSLWNLTGISAALLPKCLSNFRVIGKVYTGQNLGASRFHEILLQDVLPLIVNRCTGSDKFRYLYAISLSNIRFTADVIYKCNEIRVIQLDSMTSGLISADEKYAAHGTKEYRKVSNIRRTKFQNLNASRLIL